MLASIHISCPGINVPIPKYQWQSGHNFMPRQPMCKLLTGNQSKFRAPAMLCNVFKARPLQILQWQSVRAPAISCFTAPMTQQAGRLRHGHQIRVPVTKCLGQPPAPAPAHNAPVRQEFVSYCDPTSDALYPGSKETLHPIRSGKATIPFTSDGGTTKGVPVSTFLLPGEVIRLRTNTKQHTT
jgi:hypothetical protein